MSVRLPERKARTGEFDLVPVPKGHVPRTLLQQPTWPRQVNMPRSVILMTVPTAGRWIAPDRWQSIAQDGSAVYRMTELDADTYRGELLSCELDLSHTIAVLSELEDR